jgi:hypothetical protein
MSIGHPDWGAGAPGNLVASLSDMAELAVRLGSPVSYYRTGRVLYMTDAEASLGSLSAITVNLGSSVTPYNGTAFAGDRSIRLQTDGSNVDTVSVLKTIHLHPTSNLGAEWAFSTSSTGIALAFNVFCRTGSHLIQFEIVYDQASGSLYYLNGSSSLVLIATGFLISTTYKAFSFLKLVVDPVGGKYVRLMLNQRLYDLSAILAPSSVSVSAEGIDVELSLSNGAPAVKAVFLDNFIITTDEP